MTNQQLAIQFFLQISVILVACRVMGEVIARVGQPKVVGEMLAGIMLGPSLLGLVAPGIHAALFPTSTLSVLFVFSQFGLVLYMFVVGTHLQNEFIKQAFRGAMLISVAGVAVPFIFGAMLAWFTHGDTRLFARDIPTWQKMMYLGAAMSVTAFPVLARIIQERGITGTALGSITLAAGATDDVIAWCLLAIVLAGFNSTVGPAVAAIAGAAAYAAVVLTVVRPQLVRMSAAAERCGGLTAGTLASLLLLVMLGAWFTDAIGVHAVFGAFLMGVAMPRGLVTTELSRVVEPLATVILVPVFFAYSGLSTRLGLLWSSELLALAAVVVLIASVGKGFACWGAARIAGRPNREGMAIGALMNARGLMELIILNIGLERGLISSTLFTVMVVMTVVTTLAAGPLFGWAWRAKAEVPDAPGVAVR